MMIGNALHVSHEFIVVATPFIVLDMYTFWDDTVCGRDGLILCSSVGVRVLVFECWCSSFRHNRSRIRDLIFK